MSANFTNRSATSPRSSTAKELKVTTRTRSPSPTKNLSPDGSLSSAVRSRSPTLRDSNPRSAPQSFSDTTQKTAKETMGYTTARNRFGLNTFSNDMVRLKSSENINGVLEVNDRQKPSKKVDFAQQKVNQRESLSARKKLVSNYSKKKMDRPSTPRNTDEDNAGKANDLHDLLDSSSSLYLNAFQTVNSFPSLCRINKSTQQGKYIKENNCKKYMKLIDDLCDRIMDDSDSITLMQVNELLTQLKWKLLNYDRKENNDSTNSNTVLGESSTMNAVSSSRCDVPSEEQLESDTCQVKLAVSPLLCEDDNDNGVIKCKIPKSPFPHKDTVKFAGIVKLDTSTWNNKNKKRALLNIGASREMNVSNLEVESSKKGNDKKKDRKNEKLTILKPQKSKPRGKETELSLRKEFKVSDERRLDDRSIEKGLNENRTNKGRKQTGESNKCDVSCTSRDHKEIVSQAKKSFKEYVENAKHQETKKNVRQIKTKKLSDFQSKSIVKKPIDVHKIKLESTESNYLNCPESKVNILDANGSNAIYDGVFSGESSFQSWLAGKNGTGNELNSISKFKEEIINVDEDKKLRSRSKDTKGSILKIASSQSKVKVQRNSTYSCTEPLNYPLESFMTIIDSNSGQIKPTNSQLLRISLLTAGAVSNMSFSSERNPSKTSFKDMRDVKDF